MSSAPSIPDHFDREAAPYERDVQRHRDALNELIDIGVDLARSIQQQSKVQTDAGGTGPAMAELAVAYDRIARSVRRSALLARKLAEPLTVADPARRRVAARQHIIRAVEDRIQWDAGGQDTENLHAEFLDRLDCPDLLDEIEGRPVEDVIEEICRDLGLGAVPGGTPWARRTPADLVVLRARAAGSMGAPMLDGVGGRLPPITRCRDP